MPYISYETGGTARVGEIVGDSVIPLKGVGSIGAGVTTDDLVAASRDSANAFPLAGARLLPASPAPRRILCVGLNYRDHVSETKRDMPTYPVLFPKYASNLIGPHDPIKLPPESQQPDYEGELAVVIGRPGRRIHAEDAQSHILGYTVANDVTMRDFQYKTHQWMQGKAWDSSTPLGATIVTPDEADLVGARIRTVLNGETVQEATIDDLMFSIPRLIADISVFTALEPGDVILTGTPGGVGFRRDPQLFLRPGDVVSVEVDRVGRIENFVELEHVGR